MNRNEFLINYWKYYNALEDDFIRVIRYIEILEINYQTCSDEIIKQLQAVGSEFDNICKAICGFNLKDEKNIYDYANYIFGKISDITSIEISIKNTKGIKVKPFEGWNKLKAGKLFWWKAYNKVKHNRIDNYKLGNLRNLLNALGALYLMELYLVREVGRNTDDKDVPNSLSKLFEIKNWETKNTVVGYDEYMMTTDEASELIEKITKSM
jgi:hypothetical protein